MKRRFERRTAAAVDVMVPLSSVVTDPPRVITGCVFVGRCLTSISSRAIYAGVGDRAIFLRSVYFGAALEEILTICRPLHRANTDGLCSA